MTIVTIPAEASIEVQLLDGMFYPLKGCSIIGKFEFDERLAALGVELESQEDSVTFLEAYKNSPTIRRHCEKMLELNGLPAEHVGVGMLESLLFFRLDKTGDTLPGLLVEVNDWTREYQRLSTGEEPENVEELTTPAGVAGAIATDEATTLEEAYRIIRELPAKEVFQMMTAKVAIQQRAIREMESASQAASKGSKYPKTGNSDSSATKSTKFRSWASNMRKQAIEKRAQLDA